MSSFEDLFAQLRTLMLTAAREQVVATDEPGNLVLHTGRTDPKSGKPEWFGAVTAKKSYIAFHLFSLYTDPALGAGLSAELGRRRQGKSCFNFKKRDEALFEELALLTKTAAEHVRS